MSYLALTAPTKKRKLRAARGSGITATSQVKWGYSDQNPSCAACVSTWLGGKGGGRALCERGDSSKFLVDSKGRADSKGRVEC